MKTLLMLLLCAPIVMAQEAKPAKKQSFAIVELFTSEGCSSCPSADQLLSKIKDNAKKSGKRIYPLSFHVNYWNYLGWEDAFSSESFTKRQKTYRNMLGSGRIYTPQMVVNGKEEFVGSNETKANYSIEDALLASPRAQIELSHTWERKKQTLLIDYKITGQLEERVLNLALVESELETQVGRGENRGRTLHHDNVVRIFETIRLTKDKGQWQAVVPKSINLSHSEVIAYVQATDDYRILGANAITKLVTATP